MTAPVLPVLHPESQPDRRSPDRRFCDRIASGQMGEAERVFALMRAHYADVIYHESIAERLCEMLNVSRYDHIVPAVERLIAKFWRQRDIVEITPESQAASVADLLRSIG